MKISLLIFMAVVLGVTVPFSFARTNEHLVNDAVAEINKKEFDAALEKLLEAERRDPNSAVILNLLGAVYTKKKDHPKARSCFERSLAQQPDFFLPAFNLGELLFLDGEYSLALDAFSRLLNADSDNELLQFKTALCLMLVDRSKDAEKLLARMKFPGNGPAWSYAQAAFQLKDGDVRKAQKLLASAQVIFPGKNSLYDETFENLGWPTR